MIHPAVFPIVLTMGCILTVTLVGLRLAGPSQDRRAAPIEWACVAIGGALVLIHLMGGVPA